MSEIEHGGNTYRIGKLNAFQQLHVSRRLAQILPTMLPLLAAIKHSDVIAQAMSGNPSGLSEIAGPATRALAEMSDADVEYIIGTCMNVVARKDGKSWAPLMRDGVQMFDDVGMGDLLTLTVNVVNASLADFMRGLAMNATGADPE